VVAESIDGVDAGMGPAQAPAGCTIADGARAQAGRLDLGDRQDAVLVASELAQGAIRALAGRSGAGPGRPRR
jgi:hypothetical protein